MAKLTVSLFQCCPFRAVSASRGPLRRCGHAAVGQSCIRNDPSRDSDVETAADGGDVLVKPLRQLVARQFPGSFRDVDCLQEFPGKDVLLAVSQEEVLDWNGPRFAAAAQQQPCAEDDQRRRQVADRRTVGDVPADCGRIADLNRSEAADQFRQRRVVVADELPEFREGNACTDLQRTILPPDRTQFRHFGNEAEGLDAAKLLGDPQPDIGRARHDCGRRV